MKSIEFQKFIDLVTFDQDLLALADEIKKAQENCQFLSTELSLYQENWQQFKDETIHMRKLVDEKELNIKVLDEKGILLGYLNTGKETEFRYS
jgi:predicted nuclease with TOPRIM domain